MIGSVNKMKVVQLSVTLLLLSAGVHAKKKVPLGPDGLPVPVDEDGDPVWVERGLNCVNTVSPPAPANLTLAYARSRTAKVTWRIAPGNVCVTDFSVDLAVAPSVSAASAVTAEAAAEAATGGTAAASAAKAARPPKQPGFIVEIRNEKSGSRMSASQYKPVGGVAVSKHHDHDQDHDDNNKSGKKAEAAAQLKAALASAAGPAGPAVAMDALAPGPLFSATLSGMLPGQRYRVSIKAVNGKGPGRDATLTFVTRA